MPGEVDSYRPSVPPRRRYRLRSGAPVRSSHPAPRVILVRYSAPTSISCACKSSCFLSSSTLNSLRHLVPGRMISFITSRPPPQVSVTYSCAFDWTHPLWCTLAPQLQEDDQESFSFSYLQILCYPLQIERYALDQLHLFLFVLRFGNFSRASVHTTLDRFGKVSLQIL